MSGDWTGRSRPLEGYFLEDFHLDRVFRHATPRTVTAGDVSLYIALTGARHPLHCSEPLARSMGQAGQEFKEGMKEGYKDQPVEGPCPFCGAAVAADSKFCPGCGKPAAEIVAEKSKTPKSA